MRKSNLYASIILCLLGFFLAVAPSTATSIAPPSGYSGIAITSGGVEIGDLFFKVSSFGGNEQSYFELLPQYRSLMSDAGGDQFRFFQVITYDDEPVAWNGSIITPPGTQQHVGTVVDVPAGGWDYMQPGGDDNLPFYETDTPIDPITGIPYYYDWAYTGGSALVHTPDTSTRGWVQTVDSPLLDGPQGDKTLIETYIAYIDPAMRAHQSFDVLGGFSWGIFQGAGGYQFGYYPSGISLVDINFAELQGALKRSGFGAWTIANAPSVPESSTTVFIVVGLALIGLKLCGRPPALLRMLGLKPTLAASPACRATVRIAASGTARQ